MGHLRPLTADELLRFEVEICRAERRAKWWNDAHNSQSGAIGQMVHACLKKRKEMLKEKELSQTTLHELQLEYCTHFDPDAPKIGRPAFGSYLNGRGKNDATFSVKIARRCLEILLKGFDHPQKKITERQNQLADRILHFFFPVRKDDNDPYWFLNDPDWFFADRFRWKSCAMTSHEIVTDLRFLASQARKGKACSIVRCSGRSWFAQTHLKFHDDATSVELTESGKATVDCLCAGVSVTYVFPQSDAETPAERSARAFEQLAKVECAKRGPHVLEATEAEQHFDNGIHNEHSFRLKLVALPICPFIGQNASQPGASSKMEKDQRESDRMPAGLDRWAGEYLAPILWWAYHSAGEWKQLYLCLPLKEGGTAAIHLVSVDKKGIEDFEGWMRAHVSP